MQLRNLFATVLFIVLLAMVGLIAAIVIPRGNGPPTSPPASTDEAQEQESEAQTEARALVSPTAEAPPPQVAATLDGRSLLEDHCAQCHAVQLLARTKKPRIEWDQVLDRMERMGAHLNESEKAALIDYLTGANGQ